MSSDNVREVQKLEKFKSQVSVLAWSGFAFAVLQSICTALIAASGLRFAIGLASLISAVVTSSPAIHFHMDKIRIPMLALAFGGAAINFVVLWQAWRLRRRPASSWRVAPVSPHKRRMEHLQLLLSFLTVLLVVAELIAHKHVHGKYL